MAEEEKVDIKVSPEPFIRPERDYKVVLVGNSGVGKTTLIQKIVRGVFSPIHNVTISGDFSSMYYTLNKTKTKLQLWDTCGLEKYRAISRIFFRGAHAALVLFDSTDVYSLHACVDWIREVRELAAAAVLIYLVGTKVDLLDRKVTLDMAQEFAATQGLVSVYMVSSKTHENVDSLMNAVKVALHRIPPPALDNPFKPGDSLLQRPEPQHNHCSC